ncbi:MAG: TraR/DksA C4-type zinc finger protein [Nitrospirales bacterium]
MPKGAAKPSKAKANAKRRRATVRYDAIRSDLERQRVGLLDEAAAALMNHSDLEAFPDLIDQATAEVDRSFVTRLKEREQKLVKKIDEALERITANTYGICEGCGEVIPYKRLQARPVTTLCIQCKTTQEEEEKILG